MLCLRLLLCGATDLKLNIYVLSIEFYSCCSDRPSAKARKVVACGLHLQPREKHAH